MADVKYGLTTLLETDTVALPPGRRGQLEDLKQKLELAEAEHSPETITALQQALNAFLDEELAEEIEPEGGDMAGQEAGADLSATAAADEYKLYDDEAGEELEEAKRSEARKHAAEADGFAKYAGAAGLVPRDEEEVATHKCEACGHEEALDPTMPMAEAKAEEGVKEEAKKEEVKEAKKEGKKKESAKPDALRVLQAEVAQLKRQLKESGMSHTDQLTEAERKELAILRTRDRARTLRESAAKVISDADVEGLVEVDDLLRFKESQWSTLIKVAKNQTPPRGYGHARETESAPAPKRGPMTASEVVDSLPW